jgi:predicted anti-sigma-YlaC factor YlaD
MSEDVGITCREIVELTTEYLEDALPEFRRRRFEEHLALCRGCVNYLEQMRETIRLTGLITEDGIPPDQRDELLAAFRSWRSSER